MNILFFLTPKSEVAYVDENDSLRQVLEKMEHHGYAAVPLLSSGGKYIGTITEGDVLWKLKKEGFPELHEMEDISVMEFYLPALTLYSCDGLFFLFSVCWLQKE